MYYLRDGLAKYKAARLGKVLAVIFAVLCIGGSFGGEERKSKCRFSLARAIGRARRQQCIVADSLPTKSDVKTDEATGLIVIRHDNKWLTVDGRCGWANDGYDEHAIHAMDTVPCYSNSKIQRLMTFQDVTVLGSDLMEMNPADFGLCPAAGAHDESVSASVCSSSSGDAGVMPTSSRGNDEGMMEEGYLQAPIL